jgi:hypothetical protein
MEIKVDPKEGKKRILILAANPTDMKQLQLGKEVREIKECLKRSNQEDNFEIFGNQAVRTIDLRRDLLEHKPHIVHFSGHGTGKSGIALENNLGQSQLVTAGALGDLFDLFREHVECVLLNACYSNFQALAISKYIDTVIGMDQTIGDKAAIDFSIGFYDALFAGRKYKEAYRFGLNAIDLEGIPEKNVPVFHSKSFSATGIPISLKKHGDTIFLPLWSHLELELDGHGTIWFHAIAEGDGSQGQRITLFERIISSDPADSLPSKGLRGLVK